jgi:hypothetical protein
MNMPDKGKGAKTREPAGYGCSLGLLAQQEEVSCLFLLKGLVFEAGHGLVASWR